MSIDVRAYTLAGIGIDEIQVMAAYPAQEEGAIQSYGGAMSYFYASFGKDLDCHLKTFQGFVSPLGQNSDSTIWGEITASMIDNNKHSAVVVFTAAFPVQLG